MIKNSKSNTSFNKPKLRRQDFKFENGWFEELYRKPNQLHQQQFQLSDLQECTVGLFDSSACVYIDQCKYCWIFVGPSQSSVFVRDCIGVTVICSSQQFRTRNCQSCNFYVWCQSQPIIESSEDIGICCYPEWGGYDEILNHFNNSKMNIWVNRWFDVYDFTPKQQGLNWYRMQQKNRDKQKYMEVLSKNNLGNKTKIIIPQCTGIIDPSIDIQVIIFTTHRPQNLKVPPFIESRISKIPIQISQRLNIQSSTSHLFIKINKNLKNKWNNIEGISHFIHDKELLMILENNVFVPFKDQH